MNVIISHIARVTKKNIKNEKKKTFAIVYC